MDVLPDSAGVLVRLRLAAGGHLFRARGADQYVGIPAPHGNTYPLHWRCGPPVEGKFVDPELLHVVVTAQLCRDPE